ncbi:MAG: hypothetical protein HGB04_03920 [Chlorobiaceae bacterium]|nr:hypothetical protein [Chlorobiaceae bacterium]
MADYRTISVGFWNDPYTETLSPTEKIFYIYLFTCPHVNNAGVLHITPRKMAFETGVPDVQPIIDKMITDGKLVEVDGYYWVRNFIKHQATTSPKIVQSITKSLKGAPDQLIATLSIAYPELKIPYQYPIDTVPIPYAELELEEEREEEEEPLRECVNTSGVRRAREESDSRTQKVDRSDGQGRERRPSARSSPLPAKFHASPYRDEAQRFAQWFRDTLKPSDARCTDEDLEHWAMVWYHLRDTDGRDNSGEMAVAIAWARADSFWCKNFLSPMKLRTRDKNGLMFIDRFIADYHQQRQNGAKNGTRKHGITADQFRGLLDWIETNPAIPA